jgi:hypothetical protein
MKNFVAPIFFFLTNLSFAQDFKTYTQIIPGAKINFQMAAIPLGKFQMGSKNIMADNDESPVKEVEVSAFWMGTKEVTFMNGISTLRIRNCLKAKIRMASHALLPNTST